jgi:hypothetical protein
MAYEGIEAYNGPHNEEQPIIDAIETRNDSLYFEPEYNDSDDFDDEDDSDEDFEPEYDDEGNAS